MFAISMDGIPLDQYVTLTTAVVPSVLLGTLLVLSEVLPLVNRIKANGLLHGFILWFTKDRKIRLDSTTSATASGAQ